MVSDSDIDILAIGDVATDAFIRLEKADVHCEVNRQNCQLCMNFGDKIPYEFVEVIKGVGNAANAAVACARLGLRTSLVSNVGNDQNGKECIGALHENGVRVDFVKMNADKKTNYHYVLWYEDERTILVKHEEYEYALPEALLALPTQVSGIVSNEDGVTMTIKPTLADTKQSGPAWLYLSSLGENSIDYHSRIIDWLKTHPETKLVFQPGTFQIKFGVERLAELYGRTDLFFCNVEEAKRIIGTSEKTSDNALDTTETSKMAEVLELLKKIRALGPKLVVITDGSKGSYTFDGNTALYMPIYPDTRPPYERTGAGDAFASTFTAALALGKSVEEALCWAPINPMSVVQYIGSQKGLLDRAALEDLLTKAPKDYKPRKIN